MKDGLPYLYKVVDGLKICQVVVFQVNTDAEKETSISAVHNLKISELQNVAQNAVCTYTLRDCQLRMAHLCAWTHRNKICMFRVPDGHNGVDLFNQFLFFIIFKVHVPLGQPRLSSAILDQDETNLQGKESHNEDTVSNSRLCTGNSPSFLYHTHDYNLTPSVLEVC